MSFLSQLYMIQGLHLPIHPWMDLKANFEIPFSRWWEQKINYLTLHVIPCLKPFIFCASVFWYAKRLLV